ncbi:kinase-like domain-containing protein [Aspergillus karnatakaensis]|uniref:kinase-like domain-containing protein n=1 Tax=Aspergillus karnatakaensis TaxID=1810916 RepID=UPI003CCC8FD1
MNELVKCAAEAIGYKGEQCWNVEKYPDGQYSKAFLFTMDDGAQVVGKVPNPNAGPAHYVTASEVATIDFMRTRLQTPVPKVLAWSSRADATPVQAEYIIMEKAPGVQLSTVWPRMERDQRKELLKSIAEYQKVWMSLSLNKYGSLYYSSDVAGSKGCTTTDENECETEDDRFTVGPATGREFIEFGRMALEFDRGPWKTPEEYRIAAGLRELACVETAPQLPLAPGTLYGPGPYRPSREKKIAALKVHLSLHPDLSAENIFVDPREPTKVVRFIDWQSTEIIPLFEHARPPYFINGDGSEMPLVDSDDFPDVEAINTMQPGAREVLVDMISSQAPLIMYRSLNRRNNQRLFQAMEYRQTAGVEVTIFADNIFIDGEAWYLARCLQLEHEWPHLPGVQAAGNPPFPLQFSEDEKVQIEQDFRDAMAGMQLMRDIKKSFGGMWTAKDVVMPEHYDAVQNQLDRVKTGLMLQIARTDDERAIWAAQWPFW